MSLLFAVFVVAAVCLSWATLAAARYIRKADRRPVLSVRSNAPEMRI